MTPEEYKIFCDYLISIYKKVRYTDEIASKIRDWGKDQLSSSLSSEAFKRILKRIEQGEGEPDNNPKWKDKGKYVSLPIKQKGKHLEMTVFFETRQDDKTGEEFYSVYDFYVRPRQKYNRPLSSTV